MTAPSNITYPETASSKPLVLRERDIEDAFIEKLRGLKYTLRDDIRDRAALESNFTRSRPPLNDSDLFQKTAAVRWLFLPQDNELIIRLAN